jgi:hypothetical protein
MRNMDLAGEGRLFTTYARIPLERRLAVDVDVVVVVTVAVAVADEDHSEPPFGTCPPPTHPARYTRALDEYGHDHDHGHDLPRLSLD